LSNAPIGREVEVLSLQRGICGKWKFYPCRGESVEGGSFIPAERNLFSDNGM
jgi:hypothetical protein